MERETGVLELFLHNGDLATLDNLGFPSIKSHGHEWLQVPDPAHTGDQRVGMFSLSLYYSGSLKSKNDEFQLPRNPVHMMEHPTGQSDFEGNVVNGVGKHKRTLKNLLVF